MADNKEMDINGMFEYQKNISHVVIKYNNNTTVIGPQQWFMEEDELMKKAKKIKVITKGWFKKNYYPKI